MGAMRRALWPLVNFGQMLFAFVWSSFWISAAFVASAVTWNRSIALLMARRIWAPGVLKVAGTKREIAPLPDFDWASPAVYVMNHQSMLDIPAAFVALPTNLRFVAKHQLKFVPFLGWFIWLTGMVFVNRDQRVSAIANMESAARQLKASSGGILAYAEGTRSPDGYIHRFKSGPFILALAAQVPVVPVAIEGTGAGSGKTAVWRLRPTVARIKVGTPIQTAGRTPDDRDELMREVYAAVVALHRDLGGPGAAPHGTQQTRPTSKTLL